MASSKFSNQKIEKEKKNPQNYPQIITYFGGNGKGDSRQIKIKKMNSYYSKLEIVVASIISR